MLGGTLARYHVKASGKALSSHGVEKQRCDNEKKTCIHKILSPINDAGLPLQHYSRVIVKKSTQESS